MVSTTKGKGGIPLRTRPILAAAALLLAAGLAAVTHQAVSQADEPLRIGTTYMTMNNPFYSVIDEELRLVIESHGDILRYDLAFLDTYICRKPEAYYTEKYKQRPMTALGKKYVYGNAYYRK